MTLDEMLALLPDNQEGAITAENMRAIVTQLWNDAHAPLWTESGTAPGATDLPASWPGFISLSPPAGTVVTAAKTGPMMASLSALVDSGVNDNIVEIGLDLSGATVVPVDQVMETVLRVGGKQYVESTLMMGYVENFNAGQTQVELKYRASKAGASISRVMLTLTALGT